MGDRIDDLIEEITVDAYGDHEQLGSFQQVFPGVEPDDWDTDPIVYAADLHRAGYHREAIRLLEGLVAIDSRCIDAWGHLGLIAFDTRGPGPAAKLYETGIAVTERSLPERFAGVLPWGMVDNRPFLRCLTASHCARGGSAARTTPRRCSPHGRGSTRPGNGTDRLPAVPGLGSTRACTASVAPGAAARALRRYRDHQVRVPTVAGRRRDVTHAAECRPWRDVQTVR